MVGSNPDPLCLLLVGADALQAELDDEYPDVELKNWLQLAAVVVVVVVLVVVGGGQAPVIK